MRNPRQPLVSVVVAAYNAQRYIAETIASVLHQTWMWWEMIIVDDGSTDDTAAIAEIYAQQDSRIRVLRLTKNAGVANARNQAVSLAKGKYVAFLDSDDMWLPHKLEQQLRCAEETGAGLIYTSYAVMDENHALIGNAYSVPDRVQLRDLLEENYIGCSTVLLLRELALRYPFDASCYHEDYWLWLQLLRDGVLACGCKDVLVHWRRIPRGRSADKFRCARYRWCIYRKYMKFNIWVSLWYFVRYALHGLRKQVITGGKKR